MLINTMWLMCTLHFGLRGRTEHHTMLWGDVELKTTSDNIEYIEFSERATKTRQGGRGQYRPFPPKAFQVSDGKLEKINSDDYYYRLILLKYTDDAV